MHGTDATEQNVCYYNWLQKIIKILFFIHFSFFPFLFVILIEEKQIADLNVVHKLGK